MLDAVRTAFAARDYLQLLALSLRDPPTPKETEQAERLYYRAYACCVFKRRSPGLATIGAAAISQALPKFAAHDHPLLVPALINAAGWAARSRDSAGKSYLCWRGYHLSVDQKHERLLDAALIALTDARQSGKPAAGWAPFQQLRRYLDGRNPSPLPPFCGPFGVAVQLARAAAEWGETGLARQYAQRADELVNTIIQPEAERTDHDCTQTSHEIHAHACWLQSLVRHRMDSDTLGRLRALRDRIAALPHLCVGAEFRVWLALAETALAHGSLYARDFVAAAMKVRRWTAHREDVQEDVDILQRRLHTYTPALITGELADLLSPSAWRHWPTDRLSEPPRPAASLVRHLQ